MSYSFGQKKNYRDHQRCSANDNFTFITKRLERRPQTLRLIEKRQQIRGPTNLPFRFDKSLNKLMWGGKNRKN